jgi:hypothetical protein
MRTALSVAAFLAFAVGAAHSVLGERYILVRLFRRPDLPHLFGGPEFTIRTLRFAWHITTIAWWGLAAIFVLIAHEQASASSLLYVISATFLLSAVVAAAGSRLRHLSWIVFAAIGFIAIVAAKG